MDKEKLRKQVNILGIAVDSTSSNSVLRFVRSKLGKFFIVTPNPEQVILAQNDPVFRRILNSADLSLPDGIGLSLAHKFLSLPTTNSYLLKPILYFAQGLGVGFSAIADREWLTEDLKPARGRVIFMDLIKLANKKGWSVFLLGDRLHSARKAADELKKSYKGVKLYSCDGPDLDEDANPKTEDDRLVEKKAVDAINKVNPRLLFVGFGAPKQEKWLYRQLPTINTGGGMVVGGTFDYISGKKKTPPSWIADLSLEWLWRILIGDQKIKRVSHAFPEFPLKIFLQKLKH